MKRILKFEADWCGPCHAIRPTVNKISEELGIEVEVVDIDKNPELAAAHAVQSVPTLLLVESDDGVEYEVARHIGASPKSTILANLGL